VGGGGGGGVQKIPTSKRVNKKDGPSRGGGEVHCEWQNFASKNGMVKIKQQHESRETKRGNEKIKRTKNGKKRILEDLEEERKHNGSKKKKNKSRKGFGKGGGLA